MLVAVLAGAVYLPALGVGFYSDDYQWLGRMNPTLEHPSYVFSVIYRDFNPVLHASFLVDWLIGGAAGHVWHADSILIHGLCAALVFALCRRLGAAAPLSGAAALCWAWNVRISEAVIWPAARGHVLATLFSVAALVVLRGSMRWRRTLAFVLFLLGLLSKETALFPLLLAPLFVRDWRQERGLLAVLATLAVAFVTFNLVAKDAFHLSGASTGTLVLRAPFLVLRPLGLGDYYRFDAWALILFVAALLGVAWLLRRTTGLAGLVWVVACAVPVLPLEKFSSRYLYMMAVGYALVLCGAAGLLARLGAMRRVATSAAVLLLVLVSVANVVNIQREIEDYRLLAAPYAACVESFRAPLRSLAPGESAVVVDLGPRDTIPKLVQTIDERGNMTKLIPYRAHGIGGLIQLSDLVNLVHDRAPGTLGSTADPSIPGARWFVRTGDSLRELPGPPEGAIPPEIVFGAHFGDADLYFDPVRKDENDGLRRDVASMAPLHSPETPIDPRKILRNTSTSPRG